MKKLKKLFFYILWTAISFVNVFKTNAYISNKPVVVSLYWVSQPTKEEMIFNLINWILWFIWIIISPIIFLIWLYFYLTKKDNKERKAKAIKYMKRAVILAVVVFLLIQLINWIYEMHFVGIADIYM